MKASELKAKNEAIRKARAIANGEKIYEPRIIESTDNFTVAPESEKEEVVEKTKKKEKGKKPSNREYMVVEDITAAAASDESNAEIAQDF